MGVGLVHPDAAAGTVRIARPSLVARLAGALDASGLLVIAGAGYGKTTALEDVAGATGWTTAWVECTDAHRDPGRLLAGLVAALRRAVPGAADALGERLAAAVERIDEVALVRELVAELERLLVDRLLIVLDDVERLEHAEGALRLVDELLAARAATLRVAVAARRPPALHVAKLEAAGRLARLATADLAFDAEDCAELIRARSGRDPAAAEVQSVMEATGGWPLGVALVGRCGEEHPPLGPESGPELFAFLSREVLDRLCPDVRAAVIDSGIAERLDGLSCRALGLPADLPRSAERLGLLVRPLDQGRRGFAYHPLMRELLREMLLAERSEERRRDMHARLAAALAEAGRTEEAVEQWLAARRFADAAEAIARLAPSLLPIAPARLRGWLERLPAESRGGAPLRLLEGQLELGRGNHDRGLRLLREAVAAYGRSGPATAEWAARRALADALFMGARWEEAAALADGFDRGEARSAPAAPAVALAGAASLARLGRFADAESLCRRAAGHPAGAPWRSFAPAFAGFHLDLPAGRLGPALARTRAGVAALEKLDPSVRLPYAWCFVALVHEARGEDEAAFEAAVRADEAARRTAQGGYVVAVAAMLRAGLHARAGRLAEAELELGRAGPPRPGWFSYDAAVTRSAIAVRRGDHATAIAEAELALSGREARSPFARVRSAALLAPALVEAGNPCRARMLVDEAIAACPPGCSAARLLALRAWLRRADGDERAWGDLRAAWTELGDGAHHLLRREWPRLERLLWEALEREELDAGAAIRAVELARPGGDALVALTSHPAAAVRRAALGAAVSSGHPEAVARLAELARDPDPGVAAAARAAAERARHTPPPLLLRVLGGFRVRRGTRAAEESAWKHPAAASLVRFLVVHRGSALPEEALLRALWPGMPAAAARRELYDALEAARAVLDAPGSGESVIRVSARAWRLELRAEDLLDADEFEAAAGRALAGRGDARRGLLEQAIRLWSGEPLPEERSAGWSRPWRERLGRRYLEVTSALVRCCTAAGDHAAAVHAARARVDVDPLDERTQRELMAAYARAGRTGHALRQYLECRRALVDALGAEPAAEMESLQARILAGGPV